MLLQQCILVLKITVVMKNLCRFDESCFQFVNKALLTNHLCKETWHARSFLKTRFSWQVLRENRACERKHLKTKTLIERYLRNKNTKSSWRERLYQENQQTEQWLNTVVLIVKIGPQLSNPQISNFRWEVFGMEPKSALERFNLCEHKHRNGW